MAASLRHASDHAGHSVFRAQESALDQFKLGSDALYAWGTARNPSDVIRMQVEYVTRSMTVMTEIWIACMGIRIR